MVADRLTIAAPALGPAGAHRGILAAAASGLGNFIHSLGADPERVLVASRIDPETLYHPTASLELIHYCGVMEEAARQSGCDNFGLHFGRQFRPQDLGLIGYIGLHSPTVELALHNFVADFGWHQHHTHIRLLDLGSSFRLEYQVRHGAIVARRQDAELTMGMVLNLIRQGLGAGWCPLELHFEHPRPADWQEHGRVFRTQIWFDQPCNAMLIEKRGLDRPMPSNDPTLLLVMREAIRRLGQAAPRQDLVERVRARINLMLPRGVIELTDVAADMDMSSATLQRRLRDHGVSFSQLVDDARQTLALHLLRQKHISLSEIGPLVGYSEISAFSRAFRRWYGISPRCFRANELV